ncbi:hypothetical protein [Deinococcus wulumuqiensis]|uniref:hypothetical protein n=1 Tax=Deinococcus wulumuqiensis TaxID=980427 RepID=UPI00242E7646|nr:hypothetical protein [Deinococcus wulumuqiensis]
MNYPAYLTTNARRTLAGLGSPALPAPGAPLTITEHRFHPAQTYVVAVNTFGDVLITCTTRNTFGFSHASGHCISRNPDA